MRQLVGGVGGKLMARFDTVFFDSGGTLYGVFDGGDCPAPGEVSAGRCARVAAALATYVAQAPDGLEAAIEACEAELPLKLGAGYNFHRLMIGVLERLGLTLGDEIAACLADAYAGPRYAGWLFPGTAAMLESLEAAGLYLGIIANTAWPGFCMDRAFAGVGLLHFFKTRIYSGDEGVEKPDPEFFRIAERISGQAGQRILYVGDNIEKDIKGAKNINWSTALRRSSQQTSNGLADFEFDRCEELVEFVLGG
jgi:FMN phosphatase YigB (HAD superfamily)